MAYSIAVLRSGSKAKEKIMLTIGQFSKICQVSVKALRHYDKIGLLSPSHTDGLTGYRYYSMELIPEMLLIQRLKRYGFSHMEIKSMTAARDSAVMKRLLRERLRALENELFDLSITISELKKHLTEFERTGNIMSYQNEYHVHIEHMSDIPVLSSRQNMSVDDFGKYYGILYEKVAREHIPTDGKVLAIYHDEEFDRHMSDIELALGVLDEAAATRILPGGDVAVTIHKGPYSSLSDAYGAVTRWISENGCHIAGAPWELYIKTQFDGLTPDLWETKIVFPIQKN